MTDLVDRLRRIARGYEPTDMGVSVNMDDAADEIEKLRAALREMVQVNAAFARTIVTAAATDDLKDELHAAGIADGFGERARVALGEPQP